MPQLAKHFPHHSPTHKTPIQNEIHFDRAPINFQYPNEYLLSSQKLIHIRKNHSLEQLHIKPLIRLI